MFRVIVPSCLLLLLLAYATAQTTASKSGADALPDGPGKEVVQRKCLSCHNVHIITSKRGDEDVWVDTVSKMIGRGANISDDDAETVVEYMAAHYGPTAPKPEDTALSKQGNTSASPPASPSSSSSSTANAPEDKGHQSVPPPVNVNKAAIDELESSLNLSRVEAEAIVHYRQLNGDFKTMQQLLSVPGLDVDKIRKDEKKIAF
jgi:competence ComEA-like helix-hairpin-helix protein